MKNTIDLHIETIARMRGGILYRSQPPLIDNLGLVSLQTLITEKGYRLEAGNYVVTFKEIIPQEIVDANYVTWTNFNQPDLIRMGMHLDINFQPFCGFLTIGYASVIEQNARLGSFSWELVFEEEINLDELKGK